MKLWIRLLCVLCLPAGSVMAQESKSGFGDWSPWKPIGLAVSYYNILPREDGNVQMWFDANFQGVDSVIGLAGPSLDKLKRELPRFDAGIVRGYKKHKTEKPARKTPIISRTSATKLADGSYIVLSNIGPEYKGGASELYPALFVSANGKRGKWKHLGPPAGEPKQWLDDAHKANKKIRCEGGSIIQLPDGRLRMYVRGYGAGMAIAEADKPEGPWKFWRNADGSIHDIQKRLPGGGWLFPIVMPIGEHGYLMTGGNKWPPTEIWAAYSADGIRFTVLEDKPAMLPQEVVKNAPTMKCLRGAYDPKTGQFEAVANVWNRQKRWYDMYAGSCKFNTDVFKNLPKADLSRLKAPK